MEALDITKSAEGFKPIWWIEETITGISQKVLTDNLHSMEKDSTIIRTAYAEVSPRVEYKLSELGDTMRPIISAMETWGLSYQEIVRDAPE